MMGTVIPTMTAAEKVKVSNIERNSDRKKLTDGRKHDSKKYTTTKL